MDLDRFAAQATGLHRTLVRVTYAVSGDRDLAEECAQEALLRAWRQLDDGRRIESLEAWCVTTALNWCRSQQRRAVSERGRLDRLRSRVAAGGGGTSDPAAAAEGGTIGEDVRRAVLDLPRRQREVVVLHYLLDLGVDEVAARLGRSPGAVKNALHHARASLSRSLAAPEGSREDAT